MDYKIKQLDYYGLVNLLTKQITPEIRSLVLQQLTYLNDKLLNNQQYVQPDLARASMLQSRKKDATEIQHPSTSSLRDESINRNKTSIDLDDIIDDIVEEENAVSDLDLKLEKIRALQAKVTKNKDSIRNSIGSKRK